VTMRAFGTGKAEKILGVKGEDSVSTIPLPALGIQAPAPPPDPISQFMRARQAANLGLETQFKQGQVQSQENANKLQQLQITETQRQADERDAIRKAFVANNGDIDATVKQVAQNPVVAPQTLQQLQLHSLALGSALDAKSEADLKLHATQIDNLQGLFKPVFDMPANAPPDQLENLYQRQRSIALASPKTYGLDNPQALQQVPEHFPGKQAGELYMASMAGSSAQIEQRLKSGQAEEATGKAGQAAAETANLQAQLPKYQAEAGVAPQMAQLDVQGKQASIAEAQARTAQTKMQTAQMANLPEGLKGVASHLIGPASAAADKAGNEYLAAKEASDNLSDFLEEAKSGNKTAVKIVPLQGALQITTSQGVHRINRTEVDQYGGGGDAYDRVAGKIGGVLTGKSITDDVLNSMDAMQQRIAQNSKKLYSDKLDTANQTYGSHFTPNFGTQRKASGPPPGATHIVLDPRDGKNHYTNPAGTVDYGVAP
jgi:hypothetical protein